MRTLEALVERDRGWVAGDADDLEEAEQHDLAAIELAGDGRYLDKPTYSTLFDTAGYHRGAELGDAYAQNEWGKLLWFGIAPVKTDRAAAIPWFEKAAAKGLPDAVSNLAWARKLLANQR